VSSSLEEVNNLDSDSKKMLILWKERLKAKKLANPWTQTRPSTRTPLTVTVKCRVK